MVKVRIIFDLPTYIQYIQGLSQSRLSIADHALLLIINATNRLPLYRHSADHIKNTSTVAWCGPHRNHLLLPESLCYLATSCNIHPQRTQLPLLHVGTCLLSRCLAMLWANLSQYVHIHTLKFLFETRGNFELRSPVQDVEGIFKGNVQA
jgi:hypothetical protein